MVWFTYTEKRKRYVNDNAHTLLGFVPAGATELREGGREQRVDESMSTLGFASSELVPLKHGIAQSCVL